MFRTLLMILSIFCALPAHANRAPVVLAAASLQESMTEAAAIWTRMGHSAPVISFAASSALARQIVAGAPADLFVSADGEWMDDVQRRGLLADGTRRNLLGNRLVLIARRSYGGGVVRTRGDWARALGKGRIAMADPDAVPAGRYGQAAFRRLGVWDGVARRVVRAENVRAALALVERGAAELGVVYATDARASTRVRILGVFPAASHPPIVYPIARLKRATNPEVEAFRWFLLSRTGQAVFVRHGFSTR